MIRVHNFTKYYGKFKAVDNISFEIAKGDIVGFVGKNGAGKSTTIRSIMNFLSPTTGECSINGLDSIKDAKKIREFTGYMSSDSAFYGNITCKELFKLCVKLSGVGFDEAEELSKYFELDMNKKMSELSLGNRKKVAIIQALLKNSELLILDEPTNGLGPLMQEKFFEIILEKNKKGATIFLSSHNLVEIEKYCNRVLIIKDGQLIDDIDMINNEIKRTQVVTYKTKTGEDKTYDFDGDINDLIKELATVDLSKLEIKNKSVEDEFIKYYRGEEV